MSEREAKYYRMLSKKFDVTEKLFEAKEDYNELEADKASVQKKQAKGNAEVEEQQLKIVKLRNDGKEDKALKQEMKLKKKESDIAQFKRDIQEIQSKIEKKKLDILKIESELQKVETQLRSDFAEKFTQM
jgi:chromosome segregation ATPase